MSTPESLLMYDLEPWIKGILKPFYLEIISNIHKSCRKVEVRLFSVWPVGNLRACVLCVFVWMGQWVGDRNGQ